MTVIAVRVGQGVGHMATDSAVDNGGIIYDGGSKVHRIAPWLLVGATGAHVLSEMVQGSVLPDAAGADRSLVKKWWRDIRTAAGKIGHLSATSPDEPSECLPGHGLAVTPDRIYLLSSDGAVVPLETPYAAIGAGEEVALGALCAGATPDVAVAAACRHVDGCGGPVHAAAVTR